VKAAVRSAYRQYWFYASPTKFVIRQTVRSFFQGRARSDAVLEVGGGTSMMRRTLVGACRPKLLVSSDLEPTDATDLACDAQALPFPPATFDVVVAFELMEHLPDTNKFLEEVHRVARPGGHVVVSVPFLFGVHDHQDFYRFTTQGLERVLADHDLSVVVSAKSGGTWFTLVTLVIEYVRTLALPSADGWRSRGWQRRAHLALSTVLTIPLTPLAWIAFGIDALIDPNSRNPSGLVAVATVGTRSGGATHAARLNREAADDAAAAGGAGSQE
jgi:ubiquinone/menaquinone biosynthesis C-methylase UbiE